MRRIRVFESRANGILPLKRFVMNDYSAIIHENKVFERHEVIDPMALKLDSIVVHLDIIKEHLITRIGVSSHFQSTPSGLFVLLTFPRD